MNAAATEQPTQARLVAMSNEQLAAYREQVRNLAIDTNDPTGAYGARRNLVDALLADRKAQS